MQLPAFLNFAFIGATQRRLRRQYGLLAMGLVLLTCWVGWALLENLNARDLQRHTRVSQLILSRAERQVEFLLARYGKYLVSLASDENFAKRLMTETPVSAKASPLYRLIHSNSMVHTALWFDLQGQLQAAMVRGADRPVLGNLPALRQALPMAALQDGLALDGQSLWFSPALEVGLEPGERKRLIFGSVAMTGAQGQTLGYLMLGLNFEVLTRVLANPADNLDLVKIALHDGQGQTLMSWAANAQPQPASETSRPWQSPTALTWLGRRFDDHQVLASPVLFLQAWTDQQGWQNDQRHNTRVVLSTCGAVLCLLLLALWRLYGQAYRQQQLLAREAHVRRSARLGYWRFEPAEQHLVLGEILLRAFDLRPHDGLWADLLAGIATPQDRQALVDAVARCSLNGQRFELEVELRHPKQGHTGWALVTGELSESGTIEGAMQDITQRKQAEMAAEVARSNMRSIVDWAKLGVWELDIPSDERRINRYLHDMLGLKMSPDQEFVAHDWTAKVHPEDLQAMRQARSDYLAGKSEAFKTHCRIRHTDGHWVFLVIEGQNIALDAKGQPTVMRGTAIDVTELYEARIDAEEANQAKTRFLSRMSHELRTPLNGIMGYAQLLRMSPNLDAQEQDHLNAVLAGSRHLLNLVNDLLQITRDDLPALHLQRERLNLSELTLRCTSLMQPLMLEKQLVLHNRISAQHWVLADRLRAKQCIINILANAIKFSPDGSRITLEVSQPSANRLRLSVRDQGPGIAPEVGQLVFEPFYRGQDTQQTAEGAGIGLTVSLRLAQQMDGDISFESTLGVGTVFHLDLPAATITPMTTSRTPAPADDLAERIS